ncbi:hypothetical protein KSP35_19845 [Aquihabitans sp. G128]|uniref:DUF6932 family protein n=1 Tax=Aquihabitans sp. G128 TaxID=2849779 RepID=UPI001C230496|nr:hypothetical protein [Aquihabitans sp. G128]QXC60549.1 hypothetical protein KSP35_19845 [Aquihabitans sp. G128]
MPVPALTVPDGLLPLGRYACTRAEMRAAFVDAAWAQASTTRSDVWNDFETATEQLIRATSPSLIQCMWVGGSFVTDKLNPDDVDVIYLLKASQHSAIGSSKRRRIQEMVGRNVLRAKTGLRVDLFTIVAESVVDPSKMTASDRSYYQARGHWDDYWQRLRLGADKQAPPTLAEAQPRRGYLEVTW